MLRVTFDDSGFRRLRRNLEALGGRESVSFAELFTPSFMSRYTSFPTFEALLEASGFRVASPAELAAIPDADWDHFIATSTAFPNWQAMRQRAVTEWTKRQLEKP